MTIITYKRTAKCSDCHYLKNTGKVNSHVCDNSKSSKYNTVRHKKDRVCEDWKL